PDAGGDHERMCLINNVAEIRTAKRQWGIARSIVKSAPSRTKIVDNSAILIQCIMHIETSGIDCGPEDYGEFCLSNGAGCYDHHFADGASHLICGAGGPR
ncbi:MAG: hypothetical protein WD688_07570, partial [Candidatus Binatia bacterium]